MRRLAAGSALALAVVATGVAWIVTGAGASATTTSSPTESEPAVPPAGAALTPGQTQSVEQTALVVAAEYGDYAPTLSIAGKTQPLRQAVALVPESTPPQIPDPRTGKPLSESSVFIATMTGQFTETKHVMVGQPKPTGTQLTLGIDVASGRVVSQFLGTAPVRLAEPITPSTVTATQ